MHLIDKHSHYVSHGNLFEKADSHQQQCFAYSFVVKLVFLIQLWQEFVCPVDRTHKNMWEERNVHRKFDRVCFSVVFAQHNICQVRHCHKHIEGNAHWQNPLCQVKLCACQVCNLCKEESVVLEENQYTKIQPHTSKEKQLFAFALGVVHCFTCKECS